MPARCLQPRPVERVWGRRHLGAPFDGLARNGAPIGEIWFDDARPDAALLVKYLFTSERLSIQVHPNDEAARARGHRCGKDEAWLILDAAPGATIGIGLVEPVSAEELRAAALDGRIETLLNWQPVRAGDIFYSPGGTIHAIGAGIAMIEIQQNIDLTYRLYDYGRARELHVEDGVAVADTTVYAPQFAPYDYCRGRRILAAGGAFVLERLTGPCRGRLRPGAGRPVSLIPIAGSGTVDGSPLEAGTVRMADSSAELELGEDSQLLLAYPRAEVMDGLLLLSPRSPPTLVGVNSARRFTRSSAATRVRGKRAS